MFQKLRDDHQRGTSWNAVFAHYYETQSTREGVREVFAYTDRLSYCHEDAINLHVSTSANRYNLRVFRDGLQPATVLEQDGIAGKFYRAPENCSESGCGWLVSLSLKIGQNWRPGVYVVETSVSGGGGAEFVHHHLFVLRSRPMGERGNRILLIAATCTWSAYNEWGGSSHYEGISGDGSQYSPVLSLRRPFSRGLIQLPVDAPRVPLRDPPSIQEAPGYPHMEWAYENGYSKKYASAGWASYERLFVVWAERNGYALDVITQHDLQYHPELLDGYSCICMVGHDEYWTWQMRDAVDEYLERGGNAARFAGNFLWQIRLEDEGNRQICYKYRAFGEDPLYQSGSQRFTTTFWEAAAVNRPGAQTFGLNASRGVYAGWAGCCPRGPGGFTVYRPEHWSFAHTGLGYADMFGADSKVFGYEVDGLDYTFENGLPAPTGTDGAPKGISILAMSPATLDEHAPDGYNGDLFIGQDDVNAAATALYGSASPEHTERLKRGSGMVVTFTKGKGQVFHAGTCEWVSGLKDSDPYVEQITRNVLDRFLRT